MTCEGDCDSTMVDLAGEVERLHRRFEALERKVALESIDRLDGVRRLRQDADEMIDMLATIARHLNVTAGALEP